MAMVPMRMYSRIVITDSALTLNPLLQDHRFYEEQENIKRILLQSNMQKTALKANP